jgi:hypothetical protein
VQDGQADITVFHPADGVWYRLLSSSGSFVTQTFASNGDRPLVGDFDGDGKHDTAVFRPLSGDWYFLLSQTGVFAAKHWGINGDLPALAAFVARLRD